MTNAPASIIFIPVPVPSAGSQEPWRRVKPPPYPTQRREPPGLRQAIPISQQIDAIRQRGRELLAATRAQRSR
jgi:hypothetical protein